MSAKRFWLAVALQILLLFGMIGSHQYTLWYGRPVLLKTAPIDPWDPLRGEYVSLNYDISRLQPDTVPMTGLPYRSGQPVYVALQPGNPYWTAVAVSDTWPGVAPGQIVLRGTVQWFNEGYDPAKDPKSVPTEPVPTQPPADPSKPIPPPEYTPIPAQVFIRYGIEQFYVPEGQGKDLQNRQVELTVEAMVDSFGRAALHKVFADGKEITWR